MKTDSETKRARAELRDLRRAEAKVLRDATRASKAIDRQQVALVKQYNRDKTALNRLAEKQAAACDKALAGITRRIAILEGRLS